LSKLLNYRVLISTQPPIPCGWEMSSSLRAAGWSLSVADCGDDIFAGCFAGAIVRWRAQWMAAYCAAVSLAHASQLSFLRL